MTILYPTYKTKPSGGIEATGAFQSHERTRFFQDAEGTKAVTKNSDLVGLAVSSCGTSQLVCKNSDSRPALCGVLGSGL